MTVQASELAQAIRHQAAALARIELALEVAAEERRQILALLRTGGQVLPAPAADDPAAELAAAIRAGYGKDFCCGELLAWCERPGLAPGLQRAVRDAAARLLGGSELDAKALGEKLAKCPQHFIRLGEKNRSARWGLTVDYGGDPRGPGPLVP